ncbi:MAG: Hint domain-containing protein, partial [Paracoccaceae bacterium]
AGDGHDTVLAGDGDNTVFGGAGDDSIITGIGADSIDGGDGNDTIRGAAGDDTIFGGLGDDSIFGNEDDDSIFGGDGADSIYGEFGNDYIEGGAGDDHLEGNEGADTIYGGDGNDWIRGSYDNDEIWGGAGDDYLWGGFGDDTFHIENGFGNDTIDAEAVDEVNGDTLDLSAVTDDLVVDLTHVNPEIGSFTDGIGVGIFDEIEHIVLGGGRDTIKLADGSGSDTVQAFDMADSGDGTTNDQLDVSGLTSDGGITPVTTADVVVTDTNGDGTGDAILTFPGGESITLIGVQASQLDSAAELESIGIPAVSALDHVVEGTAGDDLINAAYAGDPEGDVIDGNDAADGSNDDRVLAGDGNDSVYGLDGDDSLYGEAGADYIAGGVGDDYIDGGADGDDLDGDDGNDTLIGNIGDDGLDGGTGNDSLVGGDGNDSLWGRDGDDTLDGGAGNDAIYADAGNDSVLAGAGTDFISLTGGNDTVDAGDDDDNIVVNAGAYADGAVVTVDGGTGGVDSDTLNLSSWDAYRNLSTGTDADGDSSSGSVELQDASGNWITVNFSEIETLVLPATDLTPDHIVEGTAAGDLITDTYTGDPDGDMVDNNDAADGSNDDVIYGYGGDDIIDAGLGSNTIFGGDGNDQLYGGSNADSLDGGSGDDSLYSGLGDDTVLGGDGADSIFASGGADLIDAGAGNDTIRFTDADTVLGGDGDDLFRADALVLDGSPIDITGGEGAETAGDTLYSGTYNGDVQVDLTAGGSAADPESGTMQLGTTTVTFSEIETVQTGAGNDSVTGSDGDDNVSTGAGADTVAGGAGDDRVDLGAGDGAQDLLLFSDGDGNDTVTGFEAPADNGDGTFSGQDLLDVSGLTDGSGNPVDVGDVTVTDTNGDGTGDAILQFPNGESITLTGVSPSQVGSDDQLVAMGIPAASGDFLVEGTAGADLINTAYAGDPEGDMIDNGDAADGSDDDYVLAGAGDDSIDAGFGNDTIYGEAGDDEFFLDGALQNDVIVGGEAGEDGQGDRINLSTIADDITVTFTGAEQGTISDGSATTTFSEIEDFQLGTGNDSVIGSDGAEHIIGNYGDDTILGGGGNDTIFSGFDDDSVEGGAGDDVLWTSSGADTVEGGTGNDQIDLGPADGEADVMILSDGDGNDVVSSFEAPIDNGDGTFTGQDRLDVTGLTDASGNPVSAEDVTVTDTNGDGSGDAILTFPDGTSVTLIGVDVGEVSSIDQLVAMGIPAPAGDFIVEGTAGADLIDTAYGGDPEGDRVDNNDGADGTDSDSIEAGAGDDTVLAGDGADTVIGGLGDDSIEGGLGDDSILADEGDDIVFGGDGNDTMFGYEGNDTVDGGAGDDVINTRTSPGTGVPDTGYPGYFAGDSDPANDLDSVSGGDGNDTILTGDDDDFVDGGSGNDSIDAGFDDDTVLGGDGADTILANEGSDLVDGGLGDDLIYGDGTDTLTGPLNIDDATDLAPTNGLDTLSGGDGNDTIYGMDDADLIHGDAGDDWLDGGIDDDTVDGGLGNDTVLGGDGADLLSGGEGADLVEGGAGADTIAVAEGDAAYGQDGDDLFLVGDLGEAGAHDVTIVGGEGDETLGDTLDFQGQTHWSDVTYTNTDPGAGGGLSGYATLADGSVVTFSEIENVVICFTAGTRIATATGPREVEDLKPGDLVVTRDRGLQPLRWIGSRTVPARGSLAPVRFEAGVLGNDRPLLVSPQHRMLIGGHRAALLFGEGEVLASAKHLENGGSIARAPGDTVTYVHILFDRHEIVYAEGAPSESFFPGEAGLSAVEEAAREELFTLFPELRSTSGGFEATARMCLRGPECRLLRLG